ncbi:T9SS type A sorting domain-containing protein [Carboxylicivirga sediminis]|uniref:T9SS type A sorting domain-containing protein n=1 Tax=Carboxylicivirga sediminis TaxID=2006564 RepID=A0A941F3P4_9BACT|nr:T9SS type A sorting domain-containing protein [Carboxylicivirga sediminis]MBR8535225.1 T9SS type A sorting domain-containing protein [Carboxylicivirga sediminis]
MNRFTLLLIAIITLGSSARAQRMAEQNAYLVHTFDGTLSSVQAYADGVMWLGNDGTNDVVGYSLDGTSFSTLESLEAGSSSMLNAWMGSNTAFFYGNKTSDGAGTDLRVNDNGTGRLLWDMSGGHDPAHPALTNVVRVNQGADGYRYYYIAQGTYVAPTGDEVILWESDGTDFGTFEVEKGLTNENPFDPNERISVKVTNGHTAGKLVSTVHNDKLHIVASAPGPLGNPSAIYYVDYNAGGSTLEFLADIENEVYAWTHLIGMGDYLYAISDDGAMVAIDHDGEKLSVNNGSLLSFASAQPLINDDKIYAISNANGLKKLAIISSPNEVELIHINAEAETDNVSNLLINGNKLFFWASHTGSNDYYLYMLRIDMADAQPVEVGFIYEGSELTSMEAIADGSLVYSYKSSYGSSSKITEGFGATAYMAVDDDNIEGAYTYSWDGDIVDIIAQGNKLFYFIQAEDKVTSEPFVKIYQLDHVPAEAIKPNPMPLTTFYRGNFIFNVTDAETGDPIENANVTIREKNLIIDELSASTNASGQAFYAWKPISYYHFTVSASGYETVEYDQWATIWIPDELYNNYGSRDLQLTPDASTAIGDNEITNLRLFPNPVNDVLQIQSDAAITSLTIYALTGTKVKQVSGTNLNTVDVSALSSGIYLLVLTDTDGKQSTTKITKK